MRRATAHPVTCGVYGRPDAGRAGKSRAGGGCPAVLGTGQASAPFRRRSAAETAKTAGVLRPRPASRLLAGVAIARVSASRRTRDPREQVTCDEPIQWPSWPSACCSARRLRAPSLNVEAAEEESAAPCLVTAAPSRGRAPG